MHRYHRQIGGSLKEFNTSYEALSAEAKVVHNYCFSEQFSTNH